MKKFFLLAFIAGALQTGTCASLSNLIQYSAQDIYIDGGPKFADPVAGEGCLSPSEVESTSNSDIRIRR